MKKYLFLILLSFNISSAFTQVGGNGSYIGFVNVGLRFGNCSSDAMYYSTKNYPNLLIPTSSGATGYDQSFEDKFNYWGTQLIGESYSKHAYFLFDLSGISDFLVYLPFGNDFRSGKLKNLPTNFPQGGDESNLGGVYTDVFGLRVAGGISIANKFYIKPGVHYSRGIQKSVAFFETQTGTTYFNSAGYKHVKGFNLNIMIENNKKFVWRNSFLYNFYTGESKGKGYKFESVAYIGGLVSIGFYYQYTHLLGKVLQPWVFGEDAFEFPSSKFTNFGITTTFSIPIAD